MPTAQSLVKVPALTCVVKHLPEGFFANAASASPDEETLRSWIDETRKALGKDLDRDAGIILELTSMIGVFDGLWPQVSGRLAVPLAEGAPAPQGLEVEQLPAAEMIALHYPATRKVEQIFPDVFQQAAEYSESSRKRDMGNTLRLVDRRGQTSKSGWSVLLETAERPKEATPKAAAKKNSAP